MIALRYIGSFLVATVVVFSLLVGCLALFGVFDLEERKNKVHAVDLLSKWQRVDWAEELGEDHNRKLPEMPPLPEIPELLPRRPTTGFIELEVKVAMDGSVSDVVVLRNTHEGIYEKEAKALIQNRSFSPDVVDGQRVPSTHIEIVDYSVPATTDE